MRQKEANEIRDRFTSELTQVLGKHFSCQHDNARIIANYLMHFVLLKNLVKATQITKIIKHLLPSLPLSYSEHHLSISTYSLITVGSSVLDISGEAQANPAEYALNPQTMQNIELALNIVDYLASNWEMSPDSMGAYLVKILAACATYSTESITIDAGPSVEINFDHAMGSIQVFAGGSHIYSVGWTAPAVVVVEPPRSPYQPAAAAAFPDSAAMASHGTVPPIAAPASPQSTGSTPGLRDIRGWTMWHSSPAATALCASPRSTTASPPPAPVEPASMLAVVERSPLPSTAHPAASVSVLDDLFAPPPRTTCPVAAPASAGGDLLDDLLAPSPRRTPVPDALDDLFAGLPSSPRAPHSPTTRRIADIFHQDAARNAAQAVITARERVAAAGAALDTANATLQARKITFGTAGETTCRDAIAHKEAATFTKISKIAAAQKKLIEARIKANLAQDAASTTQALAAAAAAEVEQERIATGNIQAAAHTAEMELAATQAVAAERAELVAPAELEARRLAGLQARAAARSAEANRNVEETRGNLAFAELARPEEREAAMEAAQVAHRNAAMLAQAAAVDLAQATEAAAQAAAQVQQLLQEAGTAAERVQAAEEVAAAAQASARNALDGLGRLTLRSTQAITQAEAAQATAAQAQADLDAAQAEAQSAVAAAHEEEARTIAEIDAAVEQNASQVIAVIRRLEAELQAAAAELQTAQRALKDAERKAQETTASVAAAGNESAPITAACFFTQYHNPILNHPHIMQRAHAIGGATLANSLLELGQDRAIGHEFLRSCATDGVDETLHLCMGQQVVAKEYKVRTADHHPATTRPLTVYIDSRTSEFVSAVLDQSKATKEMPTLYLNPFVSIYNAAISLVNEAGGIAAEAAGDFVFRARELLNKLLDNLNEGSQKTILTMLLLDTLDNLHSSAHASLPFAPRPGGNPDDDGPSFGGGGRDLPEGDGTGGIMVAGGNSTYEDPLAKPGSSI